ncbi:MAG: efflux RND transporter periplasmic adaptor subunit [Bacteroidales bacterium]|jgi:membrane fusion protein (multidrug efflux system)|nr:efflux RND transporter periplasmic adaptor subunit [Bacteroidales bacterium]
MKQRQKYILYAAIPVVLALSIIGYNKIFNKPVINEEILTSQSAGKNRAAGEGRALPVSVYIAEYMTADEGRLAIGSLTPNERVDVVSELSGRVIEINFREGELVRRGDILVRLNDDELVAQFVKAEYQYKLIEQRLERQKILLERDAVSREDYDKVLTEFNVLKQDIEQLKIRIEKMKVRAPFDGVIGFRDVSLGAFLQPNTRISTLVDVANLKLEFAIPEKYINDVKSGSSVTFTVEGTSKIFSAKVYAVDPQVDIKTRTLMLRARYVNTGMLLKPGMSAKVSFSTSEGESNIYVPNQAVVPDVKGRSVWVLKNGRAELVQVQSGTRTADMLEILGGLQKGDTVITTGLMQLRPGIQVSPQTIMN